MSAQHILGVMPANPRLYPNVTEAMLSVSLHSEVNTSVLVSLLPAHAANLPLSRVRQLPLSGALTLLHFIS